MTKMFFDALPKRVTRKILVETKDFADLSGVVYLSFLVPDDKWGKEAVLWMAKEVTEISKKFPIAGFLGATHCRRSHAIDENRELLYTEDGRPLLAGGIAYAFFKLKDATAAAEVNAALTKRGLGSIYEGGVGTLRFC